MEQEHLEVDVGGSILEPTAQCSATPPNTIERIRAAERKAEETISLARAEAGFIVSSAEKAVCEIIADGEKKAKIEVSDGISKAQKAISERMDLANAEQEKEMEDLKAASADRINTVVELIYKAII